MGIEIMSELKSIELEDLKIILQDVYNELIGEDVKRGGSENKSDDWNMFLQSYSGFLTSIESGGGFLFFAHEFIDAASEQLKKLKNKKITESGKLVDYGRISLLIMRAKNLIGILKQDKDKIDIFGENIRELNALKLRVVAINNEVSSLFALFKNEKNNLNILLSETSEKIDDLKSSVMSAQARGDEIYKAAVDKFKEQEAQATEMLGILSERAIADSYEKSAADEKKAADNMRNWSVGLMLAVVVIVAIAFFETTSNDFKWENSLFRVTLALLLSVPAGYLARESAKHREQQYSHLQTSLSLKALSPYLATLPEELQHKIKIEMADRIFAQRDFSMVSKDSFPLNMQELAMAIVNKLDAKNIVKPASVDKNS